MADFGFLAMIVLGFAAAVAAIWFILNLIEKGREAKGLPRHSGLRLVYALKGDQYISLGLVAGLAGIPFAVALLLFWALMRRDRTGKAE
jgi:hypothetical protein